MTTRTAAQTAALADMVAKFEGIAQTLESAALTATGYILAWPTGLGIRWVDGSPVVCGVLHADPITDSAQTFTIQNGAGEVARLFTRKEALEGAAASARESLAFMKAA
ncbi:hypothetical protein BAJUN_01840 [Bajunvirus bajun]|uniref:Uncharacterized protein n=1 Tax=Brevundimonas phage vB_BgoS-Bajun TaxID=2948594 RepID=A0A9E7N4W5_9CAUD|nr:hypothetical protein BAJUN_01840 [Brevundimonas phage vB_BgoS-Bajun]